jgi:hypothetical protein
VDSREAVPMVDDRRPDPRVLLARVRWRAAEERLYPLALADTAAYQEAVTLVGRVLTELRASCANESELLAREADPELFALAEVTAPVPVSAADVVAAACALRSVELAAGRSPAGSSSS